MILIIFLEAGAQQLQCNKMNKKMKILHTLDILRFTLVHSVRMFAGRPRKCNHRAEEPPEKMEGDQESKLSVLPSICRSISSKNQGRSAVLCLITTVLFSFLHCDCYLLSFLPNVSMFCQLHRIICCIKHDERRMKIIIDSTIVLLLPTIVNPFTFRSVNFFNCNRYSA